MLLAVGPSGRLAAQVSFHVSLGARYTSTLVHDSIVAPVDVRPAVGPTLAVTVVDRTGRAWTPDVTLDVSWGSLQRHESGTSSRINSLTTLAFTVGVRHAIYDGLSIRAGAGGIKYFPGEQTGIFRNGSGIAALGALAIDWAPGVAARRGLGITARYDAHRFLTSALRTAGFTEPRLVHRVAVGVRARLGGAP